MTQQSDDHASDELGTCPHCGARVPVGAFCGSCGATLTEQAHGGRLHAYAASPGEHVARPALISTLFPHLAHRHANVFREAFGIGLLLVVLLAALRLYTSALIAAAVLLPLLYILYLYEVEVYEREPVTVLAATFIAGAGLGTGYTLVSAHFAGFALSGTVRGPLITGVMQPVIAQLLMIAGPLLLLRRAEFDETLDGLTFGVTAALGFTLASVLAGYWHAFTMPLQGTEAISPDAVLRILRAGVLVAVVNACTTGTITAMLWRARRARQRQVGPLRSRSGAVTVAFAAQIVLGLAGYYAGSLVGLVVLWTAAAVVLLLWVRVLVHYALIDESIDFVIGPASPCPECHRLVPSMNFCPACGVYRGAARKQDRPPDTGQRVAPSHG
ncbi:MAG TPA: PrsW family glutamic-type intramembrane protease [Candidatus Dormibacteraeota bacterium]